jgi:hypothetical protein
VGGEQLRQADREREVEPGQFGLLVEQVAELVVIDVSQLAGSRAGVRVRGSRARGRGSPMRPGILAAGTLDGRQSRRRGLSFSLASDGLLQRDGERAAA